MKLFILPILLMTLVGCEFLAESPQKKGQNSLTQSAGSGQILTNTPTINYFLTGGGGSSLFSVDFNDQPHVDGQKEYIVPDLSNVILGPTDIVLFFVKVGSPNNGTCGSPLDPNCFTQFDASVVNKIHTHLPNGGPGHVVMYDPKIELHDNKDISFFFAIADFANNFNVKAYSNIESVVFDSSQYTSPTAATNDAFMNSYPAPPVRDMSLEGPNDIFVSNGTYGPAGSDVTGDGSKQNPFATVSRAKQHIQSLYPMPSKPAGVTLFVRGGVYLNGRGPNAGKYSLNFNSANQFGYKWHGSINDPFSVRSYPADPAPATIDNYTVDPNTILDLPNIAPAGYWAPGFYITENYLGVLYAAELKSVENFVLEGFEILGARKEGIDPDNAKNTVIRFNTVANSGEWGLQAYGSGVENLTIEGNKFIGTAGEHGLYIAAGTTGYELGKNIIINSNISAYNGRTGIQVNGAMKNVKIVGNKVYRNKLGGITVTGASNVVIKNNLSAENLQQPLVAAFSYYNNVFWDENCPTVPCQLSSQLGMDSWLETHLRVLKNYDISYNTFIMRPEKWDPNNTNSLGDFEGIKMSDIGGYSNGLGYSATFVPNNINISNNVIKVINSSIVSSAMEDPNLDYRGFKAIDGVHYKNNLSHGGQGDNYCTPWQSLYCLGLNGKESIQDMESYYPQKWKDNLHGTLPRFKNYANVATVTFPVDGWPNLYKFYKNNPLQSNYGVNNSSAANNRGIDCPPYDIDGNPRSAQSCTLGAFE